MTTVSIKLKTHTHGASTTTTTLSVREFKTVKKANTYAKSIPLQATLDSVICTFSGTSGVLEVVVVNESTHSSTTVQQLHIRCDIVPKLPCSCAVFCVDGKPWCVDTDTDIVSVGVLSEDNTKLTSACTLCGEDTTRQGRFALGGKLWGFTPVSCAECGTQYPVVYLIPTV